MSAQAFEVNYLKRTFSPLLKRISALLLSTAFFGVAVGTISGFDLGYHVSINGTDVGAFSSEVEANGLGDYIFMADGIEVETQTAFALVDSASFTSLPEAAENFRRSDSRYCEAVAILADGRSPIFVKDQATALSVQQAFLLKYTEDGATVSFVTPIELVSCYALSESVLSEATAICALENTAVVETVVKETLYECTPYGEVLVDDPDLYVGQRKVTEPGISGEKYVEYTHIKHNGIEKETFVSGETPITELRDETVHVGTKPIPAGMGTGTFINPTAGSLSSYFGTRWGRQHKGIDISAPAGTPIYAADGGKVVFAEWMSGYGKLIRIDHGNGYVTCYAHCSQLYKDEGDYVSQGELIAAVGSTGNSTGNHLHFEVYLEDALENPLNYVCY